MMTVLSFILVLGVLIFVHECGHFFVAKLCRVRVLKFSLGFGPRLVGKTFGDTEYLLSAFPLGGYVKMFGETPDGEEISDEQRAGSFAHKTVFQRFAIVFAGPLFNILFCLLLFFALFAIKGMPVPVDSTRIGKIVAGSPAAEAGFLPGDSIARIGEHRTTVWMDVLQAVQEGGGEELVFLVQREGDELLLRVTPSLELVEDPLREVEEQRYMIGIVKADDLEYRSVGLLQAASLAAERTWTFLRLTVVSVAKIFQNSVPASEIAGPLSIAQIAGEQMKAGWVHLIFFMGFLSVNLGLLNLLPIPVLDGGHLLFLTLEAVFRKPLNETAQRIAQQVGLALLVMLMVFAFYNDITRIFLQ
ncbi:MAG: RIP metalloprotease RseP [Deltaproteobacteria bacterium]|nr:MAG: RIP metalloprotease RseP [Deltaproteobacteria bacterium]